MKTRIISIITFSLLILFPIRAQIFEYIGMEDGLSSRRVLAIRQDSDQYIWILTHKGIDRYNGKQFKHYTISRSGKGISFHPNINTLHIGRNGTIWEIGKDGYAYRYNIKQDTFELKFNLKDHFQNISQSPITAIYMSRENKIWFCTNNMQFIYDSTNGKSYQLSPNIPGSISSITQAEGNKYYFSCGPDLYVANLEGQHLKDVRKIESPITHMIDYIYYHHPTQQLIVYILLDRLLIYNTATDNFINAGDVLQDIGVNTIIANKSNSKELLIGTDGNGVYKLDLQKNTLLPFLQEDSKTPNHMNGRIIKDMFMDNDGRIWNVVYPTGITIYNEKYPSYEWLKHSANNPNSLANNCINHIIADSDGDLWYATSNGVSHYNTRTRQWNNYLTSDTQYSNSRNPIFLSLCEISPGRILAGGYMSGIYLIDKSSRQATYFRQKELNDIKGPDKYIWSIFKDNEGIIWTGGFYRLKSYTPATKKVEEYNLGYPIVFISQRDTNTLWIGTINGIFIFDKKINKVINFKANEEIGSINTIYTDSRLDRTYFGTNGNGLFILDNKTKKLEHVKADQKGLISENIYSIVPNKDGNLFLGTENGLSFYDIKTKEFVNWTKEQGLMSASFNPNAAIHYNGLMVFGSNNGAIILPDSIRISKSPNNKMVFSDLNIMYHAVYPGEKGSPLNDILDNTKELRLDYDQNTFSLVVSSINYDNPSSILYSWKLEGFYDEWSKPSDKSLIRYTNLSPGNYTLSVRIIDKNSGEIQQTRSLDIHIGYPYWLTIWAFLVYILILGGLIYIFVKYHDNQRNQKLSEEKINFFIHTIHDIRTPLTLIKAPLSEIEQNESLTQQGKYNLSLAIKQTEILSALANELMEFQKEEKYSSKVTVRKVELNEYIRTFAEKFQSYADHKGITIQVKSDFNEIFVWIDEPKINKIIRNLMDNALKYTPKGGNISLHTGIENKKWILNISDTGIGIPKEDQKRMFKYLFRGNNTAGLLTHGFGIGILLTHRLINSHRGTISFISEENEGTSFRLSFPIKSSHYKYLKDDNPINVEKVIGDITLLDDTIPESIPFDYEKKNAEKKNAPLVIVVDDNDNLRHFLLNSLSETYRVMEASNGKQAIEPTKKYHPDLILADILMPVMNGKEMCDRLKNDIETSDIPIFLLTALGDRDDILEALEEHKADMYITKPFDLMVLKANIRNMLELREQMRKKFQLFPSAPSDAEISLPTELDKEFIEKAIRIIKENMLNDLNVEVLCSKMNMSRTCFYNKLKALTGIPPADFIRNVRMKEAASLLRSQRYTVAEVSDMVGFADPKYFTDIFKKYYGVPPSVYMKQQN